MQIYDIMMLVVLLFCIIMGYRRGLAWQIASLAAIVVSYFVAINFRDVVAAKINADPPWNTFLAMLILYAGTSLSIWVLFQLIKGAIDKAKLKDFDQQLGAMLGAVKGAAMCIVVTFFGVTLLSPIQTEAIVNSRSGYFISKLLDEAKPIMPDELSQVLGPYLDKLDKGLEGATQPHLARDEFGQLNQIPPPTVPPPYESDTETWPTTIEPLIEHNDWTEIDENPIDDPYYEKSSDREFNAPFRR
ncbi:MAG: CvpA family protein [Planctomycetales bacterium]|nr:CvpA family protein [Planctomycetales bacterium]